MIWLITIVAFVIVTCLLSALVDALGGCGCGDVDGGPYGLPYYEYCLRHDPDRSTE